MQQYVKEFGEYLKMINLDMEQMESDNITAFKTPQTLFNGEKVATLVVTFDNNIVGIHLYNYVTIENIDNRPLYYKLINDINAECRFTTFFVTHDQYVAIKYAYTITGDFDPEVIIAYATLMLQKADECYEKLSDLNHAKNS